MAQETYLQQFRQPAVKVPAAQATWLHPNDHHEMLSQAGRGACLQDRLHLGLVWCPGRHCKAVRDILGGCSAGGRHSDLYQHRLHWPLQHVRGGRHGVHVREPLAGEASEQAALRIPAGVNAPLGRQAPRRGMRRLAGVRPGLA